MFSIAIFNNLANLHLVLNVAHTNSYFCRISTVSEPQTCRCSRNARRFEQQSHAQRCRTRRNRRRCLRLVRWLDSDQQLWRRHIGTHFYSWRRCPITRGLSNRRRFNWQASLSSQRTRNRRTRRSPSGGSNSHWQVADLASIIKNCSTTNCIFNTKQRHQTAFRRSALQKFRRLDFVTAYFYPIISLVFTTRPSRTDFHAASPATSDARPSAPVTTG